ncbi:uncharacterized protein LOC142984198 isoform X2 [Anticarsia gemmatalis]|uniref:uncharacterized protein LOC142984198 isoform X2 n=1 Tax=Anticarsia gemmatalis TaxID=129554 RepID=UPI003F768F14
MELLKFLVGYFSFVLICLFVNAQTIAPKNNSTNISGSKFVEDVAKNIQKTAQESLTETKEVSSSNSRNVNPNPTPQPVQNAAPATKTPVQRKSRKYKKPANKKDSSTEIEPTVTNNEPQNRTFVTEKDMNNNDVVRFENGTHSILITKLKSFLDEPNLEKPNNESNSAKAQESPTEEAKVLSPPKEDETATIFVNKNEHLPIKEYVAAKTEPIYETLPVFNYTRDEPPDFITIKKHKYEEVEERTGAPYSEHPDSNEDLIQEWPIAQQQPASPPQPLDVTSNPYNDIYKKYQTVYNQYLKYIEENNPLLYKKGNCYPRANVPGSNAVTEEENLEEFSSPGVTQVQNVYYGQNAEAQSNVVDIRPENALGRIWRTWKDTEIKISKPNNPMKPVECVKSPNNLNYGEVIGTAPSNCDPQAIGLNAYYNNLNNGYGYQYSYPAYRYTM